MIYSVHPDYQNYCLFNMEAKSTRAVLGEDSLFHVNHAPVSVLARWAPVALDFFSAGAKSVTAIADVTAYQGRLYLNEKAREALLPIIAANGELLPVYYEAGEGFVFNLLAVEDQALDTKLCTKNEWGDITWIAFHEQQVRADVFRIKYDGYSSVFCRESFKNAYEAADLKGLLFTENLAPEPA
ncbi:hypothetical protein QWY82_08125 [Simiduia curdlanivorans]|uniref:Uncharacterized protein n=1 Tax=Simiduia curdlanivorans TaxID=1492769 RepID=A0ABV8V6B1_9GAMM|nr:hypothetical protein [Simiduia curdlanivorans]MDN3638771.1 hypothetical protein [Simiduia curdlanivorans]